MNDMLVEKFPNYKKTSKIIAPKPKLSKCEEILSIFFPQKNRFKKKEKGGSLQHIIP